VDEPTSSLDPKIAREVMGLIREMARERHIPVLCNIHDVELPARSAPTSSGCRTA
jgi:phosphonate transport system ATP-binding protein